MRKQKTYCGFVVIVGRQNVGKSTLLNQLLGKKISITSRKSNTTRYPIMGIETKGHCQTIYIDTPGLHVEEKRIINHLMSYIESSSTGDVELIILVVEGTCYTTDDETVINKLRYLHFPVLLVINKIDYIKDKTNLLPHIEFLSKKMNFIDIVPISAEKNIGIDIITKIVCQYIPEAAHHFPENYITDRSKRFMASEIIREKLMRFLGDELPYSVTVEIEKFVISKRSGYKIYALILVEKDAQKKIVIGNQGGKIKKISIEARMDMEKIFDTTVYLELWVKVKALLID